MDEVEFGQEYSKHQSLPTKREGRKAVIVADPNRPHVLRQESGIRLSGSAATANSKPIPASPRK